MSILTYPLGFLGGGGEDFYNGVMENSLKLDGLYSTASSPWMKRTFATAGNRKTWTIWFIKTL